MAQDDLEQKYAEAFKERDRHTDAILRSDARRKVVVAGPGTGKTTLFAKLLTELDGDTLTLSFINALVDDLALGLCGLSDVRTLHGFSARVLRRETGARIYPKLSQVISEDAAIFLDEGNIDFDGMFCRYEGVEKHLIFYKERKNYYGKYYGFSDAIYAVAKLFEDSPNKIPKYAQIVVDEFQDFNKAEVTLIEMLAQANPILLAGDDDQSLYIDLKNASPDYIREKFGATASDCEAFSLPFCSRSTRVIVEAVNDFVISAKQHGLLKDRVRKPYRYFPCKKKDAESAAHPKIVYTRQYDGQMPFFFQKEIAKIAEHEREKFDVLVIVPPQMGKRLLPKFANALKKKGFRNVTFPMRSADKAPTLMEGLGILLDNKDDNLGYRIVAKHILDSADFVAFLKKCTGDEKTSNHLSVDNKKKIRRLLGALRKIRDEKDIDEATLSEFLEAVGRNPYKMAADTIRDDLLADGGRSLVADRAIRQIPITLTTIPVSKGLSADYVFITHFDDQYFVSGSAISDKDVYAFLVALTRAKKKCFLVSSKDKIPALLNWVDTSKIDHLLVGPKRQ